MTSSIIGLISWLRCNEMYLSKEATTKQSDEKKNRSPECLILPAILLSSVFLAHEKQTDAQPANTANPALVMEVVSKEGFPNVIKMKSAPDKKMNTKKVPIRILAVFLMMAV